MDARLYSLFLCFLFSSQLQADIPPRELVYAIGAHESGGNQFAVGDRNLKDKAYGFLQIRQPCVDDVNRRYGTEYRAEDCLGNPKLSVWICERYIDMYATEKRLGRIPTAEDMCRIWNGGPSGCFNDGMLSKSGRKPKSEASYRRLCRLQENSRMYWFKVKKVLEVEQRLAAK